MSMIDHSYPLFLVIIPALAIIKTYIIFNTTFKQLSSLMLKCHSVQRLLWVFGTLITASIFSFATDYTCLYQYDNSAFAVTNKLSPSFISDFYNFFYFSLITFSTVGYGDITPVSNIAKFIIMLEIGLSFLIVVFAIANIKKAHLNV
ncbi:MAG: potassium channel family protein [bacterium]